MQRAEFIDIMRNSKIKAYPDGSASVLVLERPVIRESGWEAERPSEGSGGLWAELSEEERAERNLSRAQRRARSAVFDLALSNPFTHFLTLTVDPRKADRYDAAELLRHLRYWLDNNVRRRGLFYVLIPEYHKDGAVHFHALTNDALEMVDSGTMIPPTGGKPSRPRSAAQRAAWLTHGGSVVYNVPGWSWGFSTAIKLHGDRRRAVGYVTKYITKADAKIGGRWYYSGGQLARPDEFTADLDFYKAVTKRDAFDIPELGCRAVKLWIEGESLDAALGDLA